RPAPCCCRPLTLSFRVRLSSLCKKQVPALGHATYKLSSCPASPSPDHLKIRPPSFVTPAEGLPFMHVRITFAKLCMTLFVRLASMARVLCCFESTPKIAFILVEVAAVRLVSF